MKLYKNYPYFQILHLYEHVLFASLILEMRRLNRWEFLDFYFNARTFSNGLLLIEFKKYRQFKFDFKQLKLHCDPEIINTCIKTIFAEKSIQQNSLNIPKIQQELRKIHDAAWRSAETFMLDDIDESPNFLLTDAPKEPIILELKQTFPIPNKDQKALQFFIDYYNVNFTSFVENSIGAYPFESHRYKNSAGELFKILNSEANHKRNYQEILRDFERQFLTETNLRAFFKAVIKPDFPLMTFDDFQKICQKVTFDFRLIQEKAV